MAHWTDGLLAGKRIIVTGAAHGLGRAIAVACVKAGGQVLFTARDKAALGDALDESKPAAKQALTQIADLTRPDDVDGIYHAAVKAFGGVDVLINNAGVSNDSLRDDYWTNPVRFWETDADTYRRFYEINVQAPIRLTLLATPEMRARQWGRIMTTTTSLNTMITGGMGPYGSSKAAIEAFTSIAAADLADSGVTANVIAPGGPADTRMIIADIPRADLIPADCLADPAVWLSSPLSDGVTARRFLGAKWDRALPPEKAAEAAGAPIAWTGFGTQSYAPKGNARVQ
ncbi:MAG: SDR family oxidoreductase [Rhodospirillaceae bacterium]|nr:SDR family oxidoreductase [Rhodospirillaceae bacterium]